MPREFRLPDLGEGIHEGEVVEVLVAVGDEVIDGKPILVIETDKATTEIPSPVTGVVREIRVKPGDVVKVGDVLMVFIEEGEGKAPPKGEEGEERQRLDGPRLSAERPTPSAAPVPVGAALGEAAGPAPAAPSTRRLARELGVDLLLVPPTGAGGRVTPEDVHAFAERPEHAEEPSPSPAPPPAEVVLPQVEPPLAAFKVPSLPEFGRWGPVSREPLRSIRRATAKHMALAWSQIPHASMETLLLSQTQAALLVTSAVDPSA